MQQIVSILLIGISLSMDTFSLALTIGSIVNNKRIYILPFIVGIFHFFMPLIGNVIGLNIIKYFNIASNIILGLVLIILGINLAIHFFKDEKVDVKINIIGMLLFALSVSIDSFTIGLGISDITSNYYFSSLIFAVCSFSFTYLGLLIGKYSNKYFGKYALLLGTILLLIFGIIHLLFV